MSGQAAMPYTIDAVRTIRDGLAAGQPARTLMRALGWDAGMFARVCRRHGIEAVVGEEHGAALSPLLPAAVVAPSPRSPSQTGVNALMSGEGGAVVPHKGMGEGCGAARHPSPDRARGETSPPSPAGGEGTVTRTGSRRGRGAPGLLAMDCQVNIKLSRLMMVRIRDAMARAGASRNKLLHDAVDAYIAERGTLTIPMPVALATGGLATEHFSFKLSPEAMLALQQEARERSVTGRAKVGVGKLAKAIIVDTFGVEVFGVAAD